MPWAPCALAGCEAEESGGIGAVVQPTRTSASKEAISPDLILFFMILVQFPAARALDLSWFHCLMRQQWLLAE